MRKSLWVALCAVLLTSSMAIAEDAAEIMAKDEDGLIAVITSVDSTEFAKMKAAQALATKGTDRSIPALVSMLPNEQMNLYARFGLEGIGTGACKAAMLEATKTLKDRPLQGVIGSLGQMKYAVAVPALATLLQSNDIPTVNAAAGALGRIGNDGAVTAISKALLKAIDKDLPNKNALADAMLAAAETRPVGSDDAKEIYQSLIELCTQGKLPEFFAYAIIESVGANYADLQDEVLKAAFVEKIPEDVKLSQAFFFKAMLALSRNCDGERWTKTFVEQLPKVTPEKQVLLLEALRDRKDVADLDVIAYSKSENPAVATAAIKFLATHGKANAVAILLDAAVSEDASVASFAQEGLAKLTADGVDAELAKALATADGKKLSVLLDLVGTRGSSDAIDTLLKLIDHEDVAIRIAATKALAATCGLDQLDMLITRGTKPAASDEETKVAQDALTTAAIRQENTTACVEKLAAAMESADDAVKSQLLTVIGKVAGPKALEVVVAAANSDNAMLKDAGTRVLGEWPSVDAGDALLAIAKSDHQYKTRALRGYIRIARQMAVLDDARLAMFRTAMELSTRPEERQIAIEILKRIPTIDAFRASAEYFDDADAVVRDSAISNVISNAWKLGGDETRDIVQKANEAKAKYAEQK
ncbi:MAG: hypothetical protein PHE53_10450 [Thermoguttaceae bacterium]|nr:hypothetical protein [Thermoguttaceae bacterium]